MSLLREGKYLPATHESLAHVPSHIRDRISYTIKYDHFLVNWISPSTKISHRNHIYLQVKIRWEGRETGWGKEAITLQRGDKKNLRHRIEV
jgi:hypothetical protein